VAIRLTGEVDKSVRCSCQIFSGFNTPKIIKIGYFLTELFEKIKGGCFLGGGGQCRYTCTTHNYTYINAARTKLDISCFGDGAAVVNGNS